ncbi:MAG: SCO family protein [Chitinophagales bacterium]|jgi:protein SCO1/2|nr:SCO family protein [Chitinophagales bacterium]
MKNADIVKVLLFVFLAAVPAFIYYKYKLEKDKQPKGFNTNINQILWPIGKDSLGKDIFFQVPEITAISHRGDSLSTAMMNNSVSVVELFFCSCKTICPKMNENMAFLYKNIGENKRLNFFSFTIDPDADSLPVLSAYAEKHQAGENWHFLRTSVAAVSDFGINGLKIPTEIHDTTFVHSDRFVLIDWDRHIRGYYVGTDSADVLRLQRDMVFLLSKLDKKK